VSKGISLLTRQLQHLLQRACLSGEALPDDIFGGAIVGRQTRVAVEVVVDFWEVGVMQEFRGFRVVRGRWGSESWVGSVQVQRQKAETSVKRGVITAGT